MIFARISSQLRIGVTINCSIVPRSRSLTMERAVRLVAVWNKIMAIKPGTIL